MGDLPKVMPEVVLRKRPTKSVTMAKAALNNGQAMYGVNDLFIGPRTHWFGALSYPQRRERVKHSRQAG